MVRKFLGRGRPDPKRGPFAIKDDREKGSPLVLASSLAIAVALGLTGTLTWLVMSKPASSDSEPVLARAAETPVPPAASPPVPPPVAAAQPAPTAVTPAAPPVAPPNVAAVPPEPVRATAAAPEVTAAIAPAAEALREVAVADPQNPAPLAYAPDAPAPTPSPRPAADMASQPAAKPVAKVAQAAGSMRSAVVKRAVNMRVAGRAGAKVVSVIPAKAQITADLSCSHWCLVSYNGQQGYIYKDFIDSR